MQHASDSQRPVGQRLALFVTVLSFNLFGDGLRDALDPKSTQ